MEASGLGSVDVGMEEILSFSASIFCEISSAPFVLFLSRTPGLPAVSELDAGGENVSSYYATLFHELGHLTGHEKRLDRNLTIRFGTEAYAAEELVAELTSAFLCAELGVQGELRHSGYIGHWIKLLKSDPRAIFTAASKASQAANYLCSLSEARNEVPCLG
jgi:hypothetical protein